jgi:hypothetical protein
MNTCISDIRKEATLSPRRSHWGISAFASAVCVFAVWAIFFAPTRWRAAEQLKAEQIDQENRALCAKFRMPPGAEQFATCVAHLTEVRQRHGNRIASEAAGMF